jgi:apolipoprotein N-acyltransferase
LSLFIQSAWRRNLLVIGLGAAFALGLPPLNLWPAGMVAVPLVFFFFESITPRRLFPSFLLGWCFGLGYFAFALHWIGFAFLVEADTYLWMMPFAVGGLAAAMAIYWGLAFAAVNALGLKGFRGFLLFCVFIAIAEYFRGILFTGFPWGAPGLMADGMGPLLQNARLWGMHGLTLLLMLWLGTWVFLFQRGSRFAACLMIASLPLAYFYGRMLGAPIQQADASSTIVRIVQPNIPQSDKWRGDNMEGIFQRLLKLSAQPPQASSVPDIIIWPESAVPFLVDESARALKDVARMLGPNRLLITGSLRREPLGPGEDEDRVFNSVLVIDGNAKVVARYDKWRLVPGGEFLPFEWLLKPLGFRKVVTLPGSFVEGKGPMTLQLPIGPPVSPSICYEAIFPVNFIDASHRPAWLVNVTNDGWFGNSTGPYMHLAQARMRAIEQGLPVIRAANTGISAVIDANGREVKLLPLNMEGLIDVSLPQGLPATLYARLGDAVFFLLCVVFAGLAFLPRKHNLGWRQGNDAPRPPF